MSGAPALLTKAAAAAALAAGAYCGLVLYAQPRLLYLARSYDAYGMRREYDSAVRRFEQRTGRRVDALRFSLGGLAQTAWLLRPAAAPAARGSADRAPPGECLWLVFGGNAMLALDWLPLCAELDARGAQRHSFLLLDYPGYGDCAGAPSPASIRASALAAVAALTAQELEQAPSARGTRRVNLLGCSLGAAAALETAVALGEGEGKVGVDACVLLCPFSSILDVAVAHRVVPAFLPGSLAALLVRRATSWDNVAALRLLLSAQHPGVRSLALFHGSADEICPIWMGRALYARAKGLAEHRPPALRPAVSFTEVPGSDHNSLLETALDAIGEMIKQPRL